MIKDGASANADRAFAASAVEPVSRLDPAGLQSLARCCEQATGPNRELDKLIMNAVFQPWRGYAGCHDADTNERVEDEGWVNGKGGRWIGAPSLTASLDAAMSLVPEGWETAIYLGGENANVQMETQAMRSNFFAGGIIDATAATPALALCSASLRARAA